MTTACERTPPTVLTHTVGRSLAGLTAKLHVELDRRSAVSVRYWSDGVTALEVLGGESESQDVILTRLKPAHRYQYEIRDPAQRDPTAGVLATGSFNTSALPPLLERLEFTAEGTPTVPLTMLALGTPSRRSWFVIVDAAGDVVWHLPGAGGATASARLGDDSFVLMTPAEGLTVVTPDGAPTAGLPQELLPASTGPGGGTRIHHDVVASSAETVLYLARSETVVGDTTWVGEQIWEWTPSTGADVLRWDAGDFMSPDVDRGPRSNPGDWLHANSLSIGANGNILVSLHSLDQIISISSDYSDIEWRLGGPGSTFQLPEEAEFSGQHTAAEVAPSRVLMFDNGFSRAGGERFSRAVELELDSQALTVGRAWEFRPQPDNYARVISSALRLENGNSLVGFGTSEGQSDLSTGPVEVYEVTPSGDVVWHLVVGGAGQIYRATPIHAISGETVVGAP